MSQCSSLIRSTSRCPSLAHLWSSLLCFEVHRASLHMFMEIIHSWANMFSIISTSGIAVIISFWIFPSQVSVHLIGFNRRSNSYPYIGRVLCFEWFNFLLFCGFISLPTFLIFPHFIPRVFRALLYSRAKDGAHFPPDCIVPSKPFT